MADECDEKPLRGLALDQWRGVCPNLAVLTFADREAIYHQGARSDAVYYLASGHVKLSFLVPDGTERTVAIVDPGELLGPGISGPADAVAGETAYAKGEVEVYRFPRTELCALVIADPVHAKAVLDLLARRHYVTVRRLSGLQFKSAQARVAETLLDLIRSYGGVCQHGHELDIPLTQQELADLVGASRPVVSTILNRLRKEGILGYTRSFICIDDLDALAQISESER